MEDCIELSSSSGPSYISNALIDGRSVHDTTFSFTFNNNNSHNNNNNYSIPHELKFNKGHMVSIIAYSILILISSLGNFTILVAIKRRRRNRTRTRINTMLMHLAIADLLVTFLLMPLEIFWAFTVQWIAGDTLCRVCSFFRTFGLYLSGFIIICISLDRYFAILKPMQFYQVDRRGKAMVTIAWIASAICSAPQSIIFHVESHPEAPCFKQCVMLNSFRTRTEELIYLYFGMIMMYVLPLIVILFCYISISIQITKQTKEGSLGQIRRSSVGFLGIAKTRTLKMTLVIVVVFVVCWTPYQFICVWFWISPESARSLDPIVQRALFIFACTNSCMNPIVYGIFNIRTHTTTASGKRGTAYSGTTACSADIRLPALKLSIRSVE